MNISSNFNSGLIFSYLNEKEDANFYQILHLIASESLPIEVGHQKDSASFSFADLLDHISNVLLVISISSGSYYSLTFRHSDLQYMEMIL